MPTLKPKALALASKTPTLRPPPKLDGAAAASEALDIGSEAESIPPSSRPHDDRHATLPRMAVAAPVGVMPPVTERPVPIEPKVVLATEGIDEGMDIDLAVDSEPPSSRAPRTPRIAPLPPTAPSRDAVDFTSRARMDVPAAAPVMARALFAEETEAPLSSRDESPTIPFPRGNARARIVGAVAGVCLVILAVLGVRFWQNQQGPAASSAAATPPETQREPVPAAGTAAPAIARAPATPAVSVVAKEPPMPNVAPAPTAESSGVANAPAREDPNPKPVPSQEKAADDDATASGHASKAAGSPAPPRAPKPASEVPPAGSPVTPRPKFDPKRI